MDVLQHRLNIGLQVEAMQNIWKKKKKETSKQTNVYFKVHIQYLYKSFYPKRRILITFRHIGLKPPKYILYLNMRNCIPSEKDLYIIPLFQINALFSNFILEEKVWENIYLLVILPCISSSTERNKKEKDYVCIPTILWKWDQADTLWNRE